MYVLKDKQFKQIWVVSESAEEVEAIRLEQNDPTFYEVLEADQKDILWLEKNGML